MTYIYCPVCGAQSNAQNQTDPLLQPVFVLTQRLQRIINTGELSKDMCLNALLSAQRHGPWQARCMQILTKEEKQQLLRVQAALPKTFSLIQIFEIMHCFGVSKTAF